MSDADKYVNWLEEKLMYALCPKNATELADDTKKAFKQIIRHNYTHRDNSNFGDTQAIRRDLKKWYDGELNASIYFLR